MMRRGVIRCVDCDAVWRGRSARFCGHCGAGLDRDAERPSPRRRVPSRLVRVVAVVAGIATVMVWLRSSPPDVTSPSDAPSALSSAEALESARAEEIEALHRQIHQERLRCEPRGCEQWRYLLSDVVAFDVDGGPAAVLRIDGLLIVHVGGEIGWSQRVGELLGVEPDEVAVHASEEGVVIASDGVVVDVAASGEVRWRTAFSAAGPVRVDAVDGTVMVETAGDGASQHMLRGFDRRNGALNWSHEVVEVHQVDDVAVLASTPWHDLAVIDPVTGQPRWEVASYDGRTPMVFAEWIAISDDFGHHLRDAADGEPVAWLDGLVAAGPLRVPDGGWVTVVGPSDRERADWTPRRGSTATRIVGLDRDGEVRWSQDFEAAATHSCCIRLFADPDGLVTSVTPRGSIKLDPVSGRAHTATFGESTEVTWRTRDDTLVTQTPTGATVTAQGRSAVISSPDLEFLAEAPWVVADEHEIMGIGLVTGDTPSPVLDRAGTGGGGE